MKLILLILSFVLGVLSSGHLNPSIKKSRVAQVILGSLSIYGILLLIANFNEDSIKILNLFGFANEQLEIQAFINEYLGGGTIEPAIIETNPAPPPDPIDIHYDTMSSDDIEFINRITINETNDIIEPSYVIDEEQLNQLIDNQNEY